MLLTRDFYLEAAHHLTGYKGKCKNIHGHSYKLRITIEGEQNNKGMVLDFAEFKSIVNKYVVDLLDHSNLNRHLEQPTVENLCSFIWNKLEPYIRLQEVRIWETRDCSACLRKKNQAGLHAQKKFKNGRL